MRIETRRDWKINILYLAGNVTIGKGDVILRETLSEMIDAGERLFLLSFDQVDYLDSAGIGEVVASRKRVDDVGGTIKLVLPDRGKAHKIFTMAALDRVFEIHNDEAAAIASFPME